MKKSLNIIILSGLLLCSFINVFTQEKTVSEQEINTLKDNAYKKLKGKTYRVTMVSKHYKNLGDASPYYSANEVSEYAPPDRKRDVREVTNEKGTTLTETITIGQKRYTRQNKEGWKELKPSDNRSFSTLSGDALGNQTTVEVKYKGKTTIKNQSADLYEITTTRNYNDPRFRSTTVSVERFWFNKDGMFLKKENQSKVDDVKFIVDIVWEYEYDPSIKIEAPIIKSETQNETPKTVKIIKDDDEQPIVVVLTPSDEILLNTDKIAFDKLGGEITRLIAAKTPDQEIVFIAGGKDVGFQKVVSILKLGRQAYTDNFGLIVSDDEDIDVSKAVKVKIILEEFNGKIKPNPLFLRVALGNDGKITLNAKSQTPETLDTELRRIFNQRRQKKVFISGSNEVDATVFIKAPLSAKYGDVVKLIEIVKNAGASPIAIEIDKLTQ